MPLVLSFLKNPKILIVIVILLIIGGLSVTVAMQRNTIEKLESTLELCEFKREMLEDKVTELVGEINIQNEAIRKNEIALSERDIQLRRNLEQIAQARDLYDRKIQDILQRPDAQTCDMAADVLIERAKTFSWD